LKAAMATNFSTIRKMNVLSYSDFFAKMRGTKIIPSWCLFFVKILIIGQYHQTAIKIGSPCVILNIIITGGDNNALANEATIPD
jgi:hypothetical protein